MPALEFVQTAVQESGNALDASSLPHFLPFRLFQYTTGLGRT